MQQCNCKNNKTNIFKSLSSCVQLAGETTSNVLALSMFTSKHTHSNIREKINGLSTFKIGQRKGRNYLSPSKDTRDKSNEDKLETTNERRKAKPMLSC